MCCVDIGNWWLNPILNAFASFSFWLVFRTSPDNYHIKMHVGVCAVVVEKDKLARVERSERGGKSTQGLSVSAELLYNYKDAQT